jgi:uncharacterized membrane protein
MMPRTVDRAWQELVAQANIQDLRELVMLALEMRTAQQRYFANRQHLHLVQAKSAEKDFDNHVKRVRAAQQRAIAVGDSIEKFRSGLL